MTREDWRDFLSLDPAAQCAAAEAYRGADWTKPGDTFAAVLAILGTAATVATDATGIAGAVAALKAL
jgi:hypothetical protein